MVLVFGPKPPPLPVIPLVNTPVAYDSATNTIRDAGGFAVAAVGVRLGRQTIGERIRDLINESASEGPAEHTTPAPDPDVYPDVYWDGVGFWVSFAGTWFWLDTADGTLNVSDDDGGRARPPDLQRARVIRDV